MTREQLIKHEAEVKLNDMAKVVDFHVQKLEQMKARAEQRRSNPLFAGQNEKIEALRRRIEHENAMYELERTQRAEAAKKKQEEEVRRQREKHDEIIAKREESERAKKEEEEKKRRRRKRRRARRRSGWSGSRERRGRNGSAGKSSRERRGRNGSAGKSSSWSCARCAGESTNPATRAGRNRRRAYPSRTIPSTRTRPWRTSHA